jgi:hypothetical protein
MHGGVFNEQIRDFYYKKMWLTAIEGATYSSWTINIKVDLRKYETVIEASTVKRIFKNPHSRTSEHTYVIFTVSPVSLI